MGLVGRIEDVPLSEILHVVSRSQKNGTLVLNNGSGLKAVVIFDDGKVIQAATNDLRDSLGSLLFVKGLVDENGLRRALEIQRGPKLGMRLGQVLVERKALTQEKLEETIRKHIENLVCMLIQWKRGTFSFENGRPAVGEDLETVMKEFLIEDGLSTEYLLVESARLVDEINRNGPKPAATMERQIPLELLSPTEAAPLDRRHPVRVVTEYRPPETAVPPPVVIKVAQQSTGRTPTGISASGTSASRAAASPLYPPRPSERPGVSLPGTPDDARSQGSGAAARAREMETLRTMSAELRTQLTVDGVALVALRYARTLVGRAVMFRVTGNDLTEIGRVGMRASGGPADRQGKKATPAGAGSLFAAVIRDGASKKGRFREGSWDRSFLMDLGGAAPDEFFMVPATCDGKVAAILYGDNTIDGTPLPAITGLEILMQQVGLAMEKAFLEERLRKMQKAAPLRPAASH
jgi:hypothetical protein